MAYYARKDGLEAYKLKEIREYPHVKRCWIDVIKKIRKQKIGKNIITDNYWGEGTEDEICENIFKWWVSGKSYQEWYSVKFQQLRFDF